MVGGTRVVCHPDPVDLMVASCHKWFKHGITTRGQSIHWNFVICIYLWAIQRAGCRVPQTAPHRFPRTKKKNRPVNRWNRRFGGDKKNIGTVWDCEPHRFVYRAGPVPPNPDLNWMPRAMKARSFVHLKHGGINLMNEQLWRKAISNFKWFEGPNEGSFGKNKVNIYHWCGCYLNMINLQRSVKLDANDLNIVSSRRVRFVVIR
jgi:hypothetical protein